MTIRQSQDSNWGLRLPVPSTCSLPLGYMARPFPRSPGFSKVVPVLLSLSFVAFLEWSKTPSLIVLPHPAGPLLCQVPGARFILAVNSPWCPSPWLIFRLPLWSWPRGTVLTLRFLLLFLLSVQALIEGLSAFVCRWSLEKLDPFGFKFGNFSNSTFRNLLHSFFFYLGIQPFEALQKKFS